MKFKSRSLTLLLCAILATTVLAASPFLGATQIQAWVLATTVLMATLWITEAVPMGATSLLPIAIFPLAGVADAKTITPLYANHIIFLFIAGFLLAFAMEKWNLHKRIAYKIIALIGFKPQRILLGFISAAFIMSMWINNTAATIVLLAPALAIIKEFNQHNPKQPWFGISLLLGICYASSIGGITTPIGTAPNLILKTYYEESFPELPELGFFNWMRFALPIALIFMALVYYILKRKIPTVVAGISAKSIAEKIRQLGKWSYEEKVVFVLFALLAILWMSAHTLQIGGFEIRGWTHFFANSDYIRDSAIGMAIVLLMFFIPAKNEKGRNIMEWEEAKRLPFDILFIFGGGFCLAEGFEVSGLDQILVQQLEPLQAMPLWAMILIVCLFMTFITEITSNTATAQLILPLLILVVKATGIAPMYLLVPATFSASFAFMLPVATPPNAIVFGTGLVPNKAMMRIGLLVNLVGAVLLSLYTYFFAEVLW